MTVTIVVKQEIRCPFCGYWLANIKGTFEADMQIEVRCRSCKNQVIYPFRRRRLNQMVKEDGLN